MRKCIDCNGLGCYQGHDLPETHENGVDCVTCPIAVQCETCKTTGYLTEEEYKKILDQRHKEQQETLDQDLPF